MVIPTARANVPHFLYPFIILFLFPYYIDFLFPSDGGLDGPVLICGKRVEFRFRGRFRQFGHFRVSLYGEVFMLFQVGHRHPETFLLGEAVADMDRYGWF